MLMSTTETRAIDGPGGGADAKSARPLSFDRSIGVVGSVESSSRLLQTRQTSAEGVVGSKGTHYLMSGAISQRLSTPCNMCKCFILYDLQSYCENRLCNDYTPLTVFMNYATISLTMRPKHKRILRLRQLRRARELTQAQMAAKVGLHINQYSLIENGKSTPGLDTAKVIAAAFNEPVERVFEYVEVPA